MGARSAHVSSDGHVAPASCFALHFHTKSIRNPIDEGEIAHDRTGIVDGTIIQADLAQGLDVPDRDTGGMPRQAICITQQCPLAFTDIDLIRCVFAERPDQLALSRLIGTGRSEDPTETRSVMLDSVVALVQRGNANGKHLTFTPSERAASVHQLPVQFQMLAHDGRVNGMDLNDVVPVIHSVLFALCFRRNVLDERHGVIPPMHQIFVTVARPKRGRFGR